MADVALDGRIALLVSLFAERGIAGAVTFPDGLRVELATIPGTPRAPDEKIDPAEAAKEEKRAHYSTLFGRLVPDNELVRLP